MIKSLLAAVLVLLSFSLFAEGMVYVPEDTPTLHVTCQYPIEREDGAVLLLNEIANVQFYVSGPPVNWGTAYSTNIIACETFIDLNALSNGQYYISTTATDVENRISQFSIDTTQSTVGSLPFVVEHYISAPKPPSGLTAIALN